jgi:hypothetical protein
MRYLPAVYRDQYVKTSSRLIAKASSGKLVILKLAPRGEGHGQDGIICPRGRRYGLSRSIHQHESIKTILTIIGDFYNNSMSLFNSESCRRVARGTDSNLPIP